MDSLFLPIVEKFRNIGQTSKVQSESGQKGFLYESASILLKNNIKFRNLLQNRFINGEAINAMIFQPNHLFSFMQIPLINVKLFKKYISNHLVLLTNEELIFIQESKTIRNDLQPRYGAIFTFVNRRNIVSFDHHDEPKKQIKKVIITLNNGTTFPIFFSLQNEFVVTFLSELKLVVNRLQTDTPA
jgi:hypothetical protein